MKSAQGRTGRRPGANDTRTQVLDAARRVFAEKGFQAATTRAIAKEAGVNVALLAHYFGSKLDLLLATLELPEGLHERLSQALPGDPSTAGERLARAYLLAWENDGIREHLLATVRSAMTTPEATSRMRDLVARSLEPETSTVRPGIALAASHLFGVAIARHISGAPPISTMPLNELIERVAPAVQLHLDSDPEADTSPLRNASGHHSSEESGQ